MEHVTELALGPRSSLAFWRGLPTNKSVLDYPLTHHSLPTSCKERGKLAKLESFELGLSSNDILVGSQNAKSKSHKVGFAVVTKELPPNSFRRVKHGLSVATPELCALLLANRLNMLELIRLLYELSGKYTIRPDGQNPEYKKVPLTSVEQLDHYAGLVGNIRGASTLKQACSYVKNNSWSPMETASCMALSLPWNLGGYGIRPYPELNYALKVGKSAHRVINKNNLYCDLYWKDASLAVEYDSSTEHEELQAIDSDNNRRSALKFMGIDVVTITRERFARPEEFDKVAIPIMRILGLRYRKPSPTTLSRRRKLLRLLRAPIPFDPTARSYF